jgi:glutamine amidotransferase
VIAVIDYGIGNVSSIVNMLKKIGVESKLANSPLDIELSDKIILPGVGSFDAGMKKLKSSGLIDSIILHAVKKSKPTLGICLGMQMLGVRSEEGNEEGLGLIPFETVKFQLDDRIDLKVPHMGWDIVSMELIDDPVVQGLEGLQRYYFVHSYHAKCEKVENILMKCDYGYPFPAAVKNKNIYGFQFHPEKSHKFGMALLENFARRV